MFLGEVDWFGIPVITTRYDEIFSFNDFEDRGVRFKCTQIVALCLNGFSASRGEPSFDWGSEVLDADNVSVRIVFFAEQAYQCFDIEPAAMGCSL